MDGVLEKLNSKAIGEFGAEHEMDVESEPEELKGAKRDLVVERKLRLAVRVKKVVFSPDGGTFACSTTEGLVIYSLDKNKSFNPIEIDSDVTIENVIESLKKENFMNALLVSFILFLDRIENQRNEHSKECIQMYSSRKCFSYLC